MGEGRGGCWVEVVVDLACGFAAYLGGASLG